MSDSGFALHNAVTVAARSVDADPSSSAMTRKHESQDFEWRRPVTADSTFAKSNPLNLVYAVYFGPAENIGVLPRQAIARRSGAVRYRAMMNERSRVIGISAERTGPPERFVARQPGSDVNVDPICVDPINRFDLPSQTTEAAATRLFIGHIAIDPDECDGHHREDEAIHRRLNEQIYVARDLVSNLRRS